MEALGTAILLTAINFSAGNDTIVVMGILTGAVLSGRLTGAHFNPAVTVAVMIAEDSKKFKKNIPLAILMISCQFLGAFAGQLLAWLELGKTRMAMLFPPDPSFQ